MPTEIKIEDLAEKLEELNMSARAILTGRSSRNLIMALALVSAGFALSYHLGKRRGFSPRS